MEERCGSCNQCVDICPVNAFTGEAFLASDPREKRFDAGKCDRYFAAMKKKDAELAVCGLCLYVCPYGKQRNPETRIKEIENAVASLQVEEVPPIPGMVSGT